MNGEHLILSYQKLAIQSVNLDKEFVGDKKTTKRKRYTRYYDIDLDNFGDTGKIRYGKKSKRLQR